MAISIEQELRCGPGTVHRYWRSSHCVTTAAVAAVLSGCGVDGYIIPDAELCETCQILVDVEIQIGTTDGPSSLLARPTNLVIDSLDRIWVTMLDYPFPYIYDNNGRFLQEFGRRGDGPDEFRHATVVAALPGDSVLLHAFPRYLVVGPELRIDRVIRGSSASYTSLQVASWPSEVVTSKVRSDNGQFTSEMLILDMSGELVAEGRRFLSAPVDGPGVHYHFEAAQTGLWAAEVTRYHMWHYSRDGALIDSLARRPSWFSPSDYAQNTMPSQAPVSSLHAIRVDESGRVWTYTDVPRQDWRSAWRDVTFRPEHGEVRIASMPPNYALWRTVVEVIDPTVRRVMVRAELDNYVFAVLSASRIATFTELENGVPLVTIRKVRLDRNAH